ncbi:chloride channel protein [Streptomyces sp. NBC_01408]|uniref:chloride channel protein n=1 Tax=Streptomyces sp. NBC_01408 TaxID=2903855 RepID=UPI00224E55EE|nr:chloride channel protein [Streptomyces sp. NBC_01408]MCX4692334.1 chloride channel protein [Streptomyces sp. NBC_01408]
MTEPRPRSDPPPIGTGPQEALVLRDMLRNPGYLKVLAFCGLIGIPVSLAAFWFLVLLHELEHTLWADLPRALGWDAPPWWWPLPLLLVAGTVVGLVVTHLPGGGGHVPAAGLHTVGTSPAVLPGVVIAALASLPLGATLGPEAPLIALGGGLAVLFRNLAQAPATPQSTALLGAAGAAAAISAIFGNPLIAAVLLIEVAGVGGPQLFAVMLPSLLSSGIGYLVFTGLGRWTGLSTGDLSLGSALPEAHLDVGDVLWALAIAVVLALVLHPVLTWARAVATYVTGRPLVRTVLCALGAAACAALYALITGRSPAEVASSGQAATAALATDPHAWGIGALLAVLLFKGVAYTLCLGGLRGGPVFPALFLGAAAGVLLSSLPGLGVVPGFAAGMAAALAAVMRLPVSSVVLVTLILDTSAMMPVVILAAVVSFVVSELLPPHGHAEEKAERAVAGAP